MFCNMNKKVLGRLRIALGLYLWTFLHFKVIIPKQHFSTVLDIRLCFQNYHLTFPNRKFFFGGFLAYKMVKLTPGYAFLSFRKAGQFLNRLYSKQIFTILLNVLQILNTWGKILYRIYYAIILTDYFSAPKLLRVKMFSNKS